MIVVNFPLKEVLMTYKTYGFESSLIELNKVVFKANTSVSKFDLFAFFKLLNLDVLKINSLRIKPEIIGFAKKKGKTKAYKKFIVTFSDSLAAKKFVEDISSLVLSVS
jgi:ribosomal protein L23